MDFKLSEPEKTSNGYNIKVSTKSGIATQWSGGMWKNSEDLISLLLEIQKLILNALYEKRSSWFATPPTKTQLTKLMKQWDESGLLLPPDQKKNYSANQFLSGILISQEGILPKWTTASWTENSKIAMPWIKEQEKDNKDNDNEDNDDEGEDEDNDLLEEVDDSREINIAMEAGAPVRITPKEDRDYLDKKFAAKERVKEARLKAQVAKRIAYRELRYFFERFNLEDDESTFSDYDLTDNEEDAEDRNSETDYEDEIIPPVQQTRRR
jgi:hypothetical protein